MTGIPLEREILAYLVSHPDAKDTVRGILHWWLSDADGGKLQPLMVENALDSLVARNWITQSGMEKDAVYGLEINHLAEIREFLSSKYRTN